MTHSISQSTLQKTCLISGHPVTKVLDFGQHAYADTFISEDQLNLSEPAFPLQVYMCPESGHLQLGYVSNAEERYNLYSYSYTSSNSQTARTHWESYADYVRERHPVAGLVVEIGSNDGYLLKQFRRTNTNILGIDSSKTMCDLANSENILTLHGLFNENFAQDTLNRYGMANLVVANNVLNHANNPVDFVRGVAKLLSPQGMFVFEVPYWRSMVQADRFPDMVYHEHPSYFTMKSIWNLLSANGFEIVSQDLVDYHGGSRRIMARRSDNPIPTEFVTRAIEIETRDGLFDPEFYRGFQQKLVQQRNAWLLKFYQLREQEPDAVIIGVGAAAKANTWLNWHGLNASHLHCITDASDFKQGKYTPLSRIPILSDNEFANHANPYALILSWNISQGLKQALLNINPNTRFISQ